MLYNSKNIYVYKFNSINTMRVLVFSLFLFLMAVANVNAQRYDGVRMMGSKAKKSKDSKEKVDGTWTISVGPSYSRGINLNGQPIKPWGLSNDYLNYQVNGQLVAQHFWEKWGVQVHVIAQHFDSGPGYNDRMNNPAGTCIDMIGAGLGLNYSWYNDGSIRAYSGLKAGYSNGHEYTDVYATGIINRIDNNYHLLDYSLTLLGLHCEIKNNWGLVGEISYGTLGLAYVGLSYRF